MSEEISECVEALKEQIRHWEDRSEKYRKMYIEADGRAAEYRRYETAFELLVSAIRGI